MNEHKNFNKRSWKGFQRWLQKALQNKYQVIPFEDMIRVVRPDSSFPYKYFDEYYQNGEVYLSTEFMGQFNNLKHIRYLCKGLYQL